MKRYGLYLAYAPEVDLRAEGLGRVLAEFLDGARGGDVAWTVACPSWVEQPLRQLLDAQNVPRGGYELLVPPREPLALRVQRWLRRPRPRRSGFGRLRSWAKARLLAGVARQERRLLAATGAARPLLLDAPALVLLLCLLALGRAMTRAAGWFRRGFARTRRYLPFAGVFGRLRQALFDPRSLPAVRRWYQLLFDAEIERLLVLIGKRRDIRAWYSPTAFWPSFNRIAAPRLTCVPDIVIEDFPGGFARLGHTALEEVLDSVNRVIAGGEHFVTYSEDVKWRTLVARRRVPPEAVTVIRHGANRLDELISVRGFADNAASTRAYCAALFNIALRRAVGRPAHWVQPESRTRFIFYASQARPNKNLLTLLQAYRHLLRDRLIDVKLVLTCDPEHLPAVWSYVDQERLWHDVLFLHQLSAQELAAAYHLALLAVNPSLSEGGCPFTLTEALSVGTPVVMSRIAVTLEVMTDPALQAMSLFDPYDWRDMAKRIEWALAHREELLAAQRALYDLLARRSWREVVADHAALLDRLAAAAEARA